MLDLGGLTFFDSTGIHLVLELMQGSRTDGWQIAVVDGTDPVHRAFDITGLRGVIPFVDRRSVHDGRSGDTE